MSSTYLKYRSMIEDVTVNGMKMYRIGGRIFLSIGDAMFYIHNGCRPAPCQGHVANYDALSYGYMDDRDPFEEIRDFGFIHGIKL